MQMYSKCGDFWSVRIYNPEIIQYLDNLQLTGRDCEVELAQALRERLYDLAWEMVYGSDSTEGLEE